MLLCPYGIIAGDGTGFDFALPEAGSDNPVSLFINDSKVFSYESTT
jgi:hypothetical protein